MHRSFPAQFKYLATVLAKDPRNAVLFITNTKEDEIEGVTKLIYEVQPQSHGCHPYLEAYEEMVLHAQAGANSAGALKMKGIKPDIIIGFSWGTPMFIKEVFPDVPYLCYFEWFGKTEGSLFDFGGKVLSEDQRARIKCNNSHVLMDLYNCDAGITPTQWQKSHFPKEYQDKINVIHDGIDTQRCVPNKDAKIFIKDKNIELTANDEVITYATRGMEPYRGFPEFMEAAEKILKKRPNSHVVIAGANAVCYGTPLPNSTYKEFMLNKLDLDMDRVHFTGTLPYDEYVKLLQISSVHVYLTYPFILSWSILEAMSCGACVVASNTEPVLEVVKDNFNGILVDFPNVVQLVEKIEYALDNKDKMHEIRNNARQTILDNYDLAKTLPKQVELMLRLIKK